MGELVRIEPGHSSPGQRFTTGEQGNPWMFPDQVQPDARVVIYVYYLKATGKTSDFLAPTNWCALSLNSPLPLSIVKGRRQYGIMIGDECFNSGNLCLIFTLLLDLCDLGQDAQLLCAQCLHLNMGLLIRSTVGRDNAMGSPKSTNTS